MMYSFRPRHVNPEHYEQKMKFWKEMIENFCDYKGCCIVSINELKEVFKRKGTSPLCLDDVINQMYAEGNLEDKNSFMNKPKTVSGYLFNALVYTPVSWGFSKLKEKVIGNNNADTLFVVKSAVQKQSRILQEHVRNNHSYNNIISMDELMKSADNMEGLSKEGILMVLQHLSVNEKSVYIEENSSQTGSHESEHHHKLLIKFSEPFKAVTPITELERSIYNLETTERFLITTINKKEHQLTEILNQVKNCLKDGKKMMAKTFLRKKHMLESDLSKTMSILDNVQTMLQKVHSSKSDREILNTYKMGSESIKNVFSKGGINLDNVHDIIEDMREVLEEQEECQTALSAPMRPSEIDDAELESELLDLINENKTKVNDVASNKKEDLDLHDLELRLQKLRGDFSDLDDDTAATHVTSKSQKGLSQF
jgi:charged multivesicular body protein 7